MRLPQGGGSRSCAGEHGASRSPPLPSGPLSDDRWTVRTVIAPPLRPGKTNRCFPLPNLSSSRGFQRTRPEGDNPFLAPLPRTGPSVRPGPRPAAQGGELGDPEAAAVRSSRTAVSRRGSSPAVQRPPAGRRPPVREPGAAWKGASVPVSLRGVGGDQPRSNRKANQLRTEESFLAADVFA